MQLSNPNSKLKRIMQEPGNTAKCCVYLCLFLFMLYYHLPMDYISDDAYLREIIASQSLTQRFVYLYYFNGRIFTDSLAFIFCQLPMVIWKVFNSLVYVVIAHLIVLLFSKNRFSDVAITCVLVSMYPVGYLSSAGYISTSTNYVYTFAALLITIIPLVKPYSGRLRWVAPAQHMIALCAALYAVNHDQTAVILIAGLLFYLIYLLFDHCDRAKLLTVGFYFLYSLFAFLFMYFMPGHLNRMNSVGVGELYPPNYINWSFWEKVYVGYSSTVANVMFYHLPLFQFFCLALTFVSFRSRSLWVKFLGAIPTVVMGMVYILGRSFFVTIYPYAYWMPDLLPLDGSFRSMIPLFTSIAILICIVTVIVLCVQNNKRKLLLLLLLLLAALSREMMGFSATVYRSSFRTFTAFLFLLMICSALLLQELEASGRKNIRRYILLAGLGIIRLGMILF